MYFKFLDFNVISVLMICMYCEICVVLMYTETGIYVHRDRYLYDE